MGCEEFPGYFGLVCCFQALLRAEDLHAALGWFSVSLLRYHEPLSVRTNLLLDAVILLQNSCMLGLQARFLNLDLNSA